MTLPVLGQVQVDGWTLLGLVGQVLFFMRFIIQWIATERAKRTVIPTSFWYFSIGGALVLLFYSFVRRDPVFIAGYLLAMVIYVRNLRFALRPGSTGREE
ncbi:MAG: lipid-A-disaccharide synthase N-terminal domain-containing protein [Calditrichaeota bacterium]|nr:lipid-A-disaccharide synthase N-terminal domain-containing protein [Calditrichota bacterium]MCB9391135.1 lipid-A-disaccharide synthase N-terminal domain-containing protein [Calditrichota bacterium]